MGSIFTKLLGEILEAAYRATGTVNVSNASQASEQLAAKLLIVKGISQDLGAANAVAFLTGADSQLGPFAQEIVDMLNAKSSSAAVPGVLSLLATGAIPLSGQAVA